MFSLPLFCFVKNVCYSYFKTSGPLALIGEYQLLTGYLNQDLKLRILPTLKQQLVCM